MQERQVTIGDTSFKLDDPFMVLATQNPVEQEGTYPLPEAQVDRFMLKIKLTYPSKEEEQQILRLMTSPDIPENAPIIGPDDLKRLRRKTAAIYMDSKIEEYIVSLVDATRHPEKYGLNISHLIQYGASPRATIYLAMGARACALLAGRGFVTPQDIKNIAMEVLRHRLIITYEAEAEELSSENIIQQILDTIPVP
jgi:MoxR-like ATPase